MSVRSDLWYAEQTVLDNTFVFEPCFWANVMEKLKRKKNILPLYFDNTKERQ